MSRTYPLIKMGEWIQPNRKGYKMQCCDCGLVHTINFKTKKGHIQFQMFRNSRATGQIRRWMKKQKQNKKGD